MAITLDPQAQSVLDGLARQARGASPPDHERGVDEWVAAYRDQQREATALSGPPAPAAVADHGIEGADGPLLLRIFRPAGAGTGSCLLFFHGGGLIAGSLETHDTLLRALAVASGCLVAAVEYRLAPEFPYPAAPEDCYAALVHVAAHAEPLGIDPARIAIGGDSAGGLLAAVVALMARDRAGPAIWRQVMLYPNADLRADRSYPSMAAFDGNIVKLAELDRGLALYAPPGVDRAQPYVSPVCATDLSGLPPALVVTCEADPLRDEGEALAAGLARAGVGVEHHRLDAMIHGVAQMTGAIGAGQMLIERVGAWLRDTCGL